MQIKQWEDKHLAHFSYAILSDFGGKIILIDPSRDPKPYLDYAQEQQALIVGIIETHPHADFISGHLEISHVTGAPIYTTSLAGAAYSHTAFDDGANIDLGQIKLTALHTPGHSPDSISILLELDGKQHAVFTGDTLFIGDCGRPDLREGSGNISATRLDLAKDMYHSLRNKLAVLDEDVLVYPAHGAGSLCGKALSDEKSSTICKEKKTNWSLQPMSEAASVQALLEDQPFVPAYFSYDVELNREGAAPLEESIRSINFSPVITDETGAAHLDKNIMVVDARPEKIYKKGHLEHSVNIMEGLKFDTWLGTIIQPGESFYLAGESREQLEKLVRRAAAIGYEPQIKEAFVLKYAAESTPLLNLEAFKKNSEKYTIVDVRNESERSEKKLFEKSISIPLPELRERVNELPTDKPIVVHCAGGYRSAAGSSIIKSALNGQATVFDLGEAVNDF